MHFVRDGVGSALAQAKEAAGERTIGVAGCDIVRQLLELGELDAIRVSLGAVLLGKGMRFFPSLGNASMRL